MWWKDVYADAVSKRDELARPAREQIARDRERAPVRVARLLREIEARLFDPELTVGTLRRGCGVGDHSVSTEFHRALGLPPRAYLEARRLEVARELLRCTELRVWQVAELVGYSCTQALRRALVRLSGAGPVALRGQARPVAR